MNVTRARKLAAQRERFGYFAEGYTGMYQYCPDPHCRAKISSTVLAHLSGNVGERTKARREAMVAHLTEEH